MLWLAIPAIIGAAAWIISDLDDEAGQARDDWEHKRVEVEHDVKWHRDQINAHIKEAKATCDFHMLVDAHYSSSKVADQAYILLNDAKVTLDAIGKALVVARTERDVLIKTRKEAKAKSERDELSDEIASLVALRKNLFTEKNTITGQKDMFKKNVKALNMQTRNLKLLIRDRTGSKGAEWYARLEDRKSRRRRSA